MGANDFETARKYNTCTLIGPPEIEWKKQATLKTICKTYSYVLYVTFYDNSNANVGEHIVKWIQAFGYRHMHLHTEIDQLPEGYL